MALPQFGAGVVGIGLLVFVLAPVARTQCESARIEAGSGRFGQTVSFDGDVALIGTSGEEVGAAWIYRWDGSSWSLEQELTTEGVTDGFGRAVSLSEGVAIVGDLNGADGNGTAHVFRFIGQGWVEEQRLTESDGVDGDGFGFAVDIEGDLALIAAPGEDAEEFEIEDRGAVIKLGSRTEVPSRHSSIQR